MTKTEKNYYKYAKKRSRRRIRAFIIGERKDLKKIKSRLSKHLVSKINEGLKNE